MSRIQKGDGPRNDGLQRTRPTVGLFVSQLGQDYEDAIRSGVTDAVKAHDANLVCIAGRHLRSPHEYEAQNNILYHLINKKNVDGLVIAADILGLFADPEVLKDFCEKYHPLPRVTIGVKLEGIPNLLVDEYLGMREAITHLITVHNHRRIVFIRAPDRQFKHRERYRAYVETLTAYNIPFEPNLVLSGNLRLDSGKSAINLLLDQGQDSFDAVVAANDDMAIGAMEALQSRGLQVPDDVSVVGFDNKQIAGSIIPSLTTVRYPIYEQGRRAAKMLLTLLKGETAPRSLVIPTLGLEVRRSCGCISPTALRATTDPGSIFPPKNPSSDRPGLPWENIFLELEQMTNRPVHQVVPEAAKHLFNTLTTELTIESSTAFLSAFEKILDQVATTGGEIYVWQDLISILRRHLPRYISDDMLLSRSENLLHQARILVSEMGQQAQRYQRLQVERLAYSLQGVGQALITTFDVAQLMEVIAQQLPHLGIKSCYIALYEVHADLVIEAEAALPEWSRLILAYNETDRVELDAGGQCYPTYQLLPDRHWPQDRRFSIAAEPLYFKDKQLGFIIFEVGPPEGIIYKTLRGQISSALMGALLMQQVENQTDTLESEVAARTADLAASNKQLQKEIHERKRADQQIKASLQEKEVLLKEIHHRVKNNLQVIAGLLDLQVSYVEEPKAQDILLESQNRVRSMALTHEQLYQSHNLAQIDFAEYTENLISYLSQSYGSQAKGLTWQLDIMPVFLNIDTAIPCGLIINELATNALKHAFPQGQPGEIRIALQERTDQQLILEVSDNGVGFPPEVDFRRAASLGLTLVNTLAKQINGTIKFYREQGTRFKITFANLAQNK